eukprot:Blabericola_migrator_1__9739@NODE_5330_length_804_cov_76_803256_g3418_i0_p2_GENE_NODE_5330_length_804_cov_76_803256_g3418_i0NODE_5330_length_804_cov_76_803256_g3418_i0_p2_ORF_typecomplete_len115_score15_81_NODE_5330_length_804_cov_76_803256_g3418_i065409
MSVSGCTSVRCSGWRVLDLRCAGSQLCRLVSGPLAHFNYDTMRCIKPSVLQKILGLIPEYHQRSCERDLELLYKKLTGLSPDIRSNVARLKKFQDQEGTLNALSGTPGNQELFD